MLKRSDTSASQASLRPFAIYKRELDERASVVSVEGELDLSTAPRLKWMLLDSLESEGAQVVADLSLVDFMDSTALGVLVGVQRKLAADARLAIVCTSEKVLQIFEFSGIDSAFAIFPTLEDALAHVRSQTAQAD
ncbi:MAG TPA: STAS domain-containing protein [Solirubrobacteraceae bacterium]|jgi:anti-sigma B factor antagonist|nr:STAS domain-containing protein [Solirubrobacteraceae bacterium]